jgi:Zn-dependent protease
VQSTSGSFACGRVFGVSLFVHFTVPMFAVAAIALQSWDLPAALGCASGILAIVLVHERGHAALVRAFGQRVTAITLYGWGGECAFTAGTLTRLHQTAIAWGGVVAQLVAAAIALSLARLNCLPARGYFGTFAAMLIVPNLCVAAINLIPRAPLDGADAWRLPKELVRAVRVERAAHRALKGLQRRR